MACDPVIFHEITREKWQEIETDLRHNGIIVEHDEGIAHISHTDLSWDYNEEFRTLTVVCKSKPFVVSCETINAKIRELFEKAIDGASNT